MAVDTNANTQNNNTEAPAWMAHGDEIYAAIRPHAKLRFVKANDIILNQDEAVTHLYFMIKGTADGFAYSESGTKFWVTEFNAGDIIGQAEIFASHKMGYEITAHSNVEMLVLPASAFLAMLERQNKLGIKVAENLSRSLQNVQARLVEMAIMPASARVCAELLRLSKPIGKTPDQRIVRPHPVYSNLALRVHSTRETVSRSISELEKMGIVKRSTGSIIILKPDALKRSAS